MNHKIAIYTCVTNQYDTPLPVINTGTDADFILFSDNQKKVKGWDHRPLFKTHLPSPVLINRYHKLFPHRVLPEYSYSIYLDGNIRIISNINHLIQSFIESGADIALLTHPTRDSISQEIKACVELGKIKDSQIANQQLAYYKEKGFDDSFRLTANRIIFRRHSSSRLPTAMQLWWEQLNSFTQRDQISLPYVRWKSQLSEQLLDLDVEQENPYFFLYGHKQNSLKKNLINMILAKRFDSFLCQTIAIAWPKIKNLKTFIAKR